MRPLNPFAELTREIADKVLADRRLKRQAEQRLAALLAAYRDLADNPAYRSIVEETKLLLGEQLRRLVEQATRCAHCGPIANRITVLQEVIVAPLDTVWFERQQEAREEDEADATTGSNDDA